MEELKNETKTTTVKKVAPKTAKKSTMTKKTPTAKKSAAAKKSPSKIAKLGNKVGDFTKNKAMPAVGKAFKSTGRGIGHAFMEMSDSLAGWVDETSRQLKKEITKSKSPAKKPTKKVTIKKTNK
ncbi:MAG: hypothetical protein LBQ05_00345 [Christensenellaceae bacterium]|nr:hypothetical protein [Christensenellaceae bacterium]